MGAGRFRNNRWRMVFVSLLVLAGATAAVARTEAAVATVQRAATPSSSSLNPTLFSQLSTGVVLIRGFGCSGASWTVEGTGFLVGAGVVMTARHVVDPPEGRKLACRVKVLLDGKWIPVTRTAWWYRTTDPTGRETDLATLKLARAASPGDLHLRLSQFVTACRYEPGGPRTSPRKSASA